MTTPTVDTTVGLDATTRHFDENVAQKILELDEATQGRIFQMLTEYSDVLPMLLPAGNHPLVAHAAGESWADILKDMQANNCDISSVQYGNPQQLIEAYDAWKSKQPK